MTVPYGNPALAAWNAYDTVFLSSCSRKLWFGTPETLAAFPRSIDGDKQKQYNGKDAYNFLLRLKAGLESGKLGETNIEGQFTEACDAFADRPDAWKKIIPAMQKMQADVRYIRTTYIDHLQKGTIRSAAKNLADIRKGDTVLIIGKAGRNGSVSQVTVDMACESASAAQIFYTAANPESVTSIGQRLNTSNIRKKIPLTTRVQPVAFADIESVINAGCHVFVGFRWVKYPISGRPPSIQILFWSMHGDARNTMTVTPLSICAAARRWWARPISGRTPAWNLISRPKMSVPKVDIDENNFALTVEATEACRIIAEARTAGATSGAFKLLDPQLAVRRDGETPPPPAP